MILQYSSAQHPYVKAAVVSTTIDLPCGCPSSEFFSNQNDVALENDNQTEATLESEGTSNLLLEETTDVQSSSLPSASIMDIDTDDVENIEDLLDNSNNLNQLPRDSSEMILPLRIIIPSVHMHFDQYSQSYWKYDQFVLKTDNGTYHDHLQNGERLFEIKKDQKNFQNITSMETKIFVGNRSLHDIQEVAQTDQIFLDRHGRTFKINKELTGVENMFEIIPVNFDVIQVTLANKIFGVRHHYEKLNRWLMFKV